MRAYNRQFFRRLTRAESVLILRPNLPARVELPGARPPVPQREALPGSPASSAPTPPGAGSTPSR